MKTIETEYANTDFDLRSTQAFDTLHRELDGTCISLTYAQGEDGKWFASYEADYDPDFDPDDDTVESETGSAILVMLKAVSSLSPTAKAEFDACYLREFNLGFHCGDSWAFLYQLPLHVVQAAADARCSIAVTLYPMRNPDGTPKV